MRRNYKLYLEDIFAAIEKIQKYAGNISYEDLIKDEMKIDAIVRNFEIIGEASNNIPMICPRFLERYKYGYLTFKHYEPCHWDNIFTKHS